MAVSFIRKTIIMALAMAAVLYIGPSKTEAQTTSNREPLKIALLSILDVFPHYVAEAKGYFKDFAVAVKAVPVASGLERDQLMQSGVIDGMLNEMITTANFNRHRVQVKSVMAARKAYPNYPLFRVLSSPGSNLTLATGLAATPIGISRNTIIEYVTDRLLAAEGQNLQQIVKKSVPVIPERYQLLLQDQLKAATLPDPLAKSALAAGAGTLIDDSAHPRYSVSVLSFKVDALDKKSESVQAYLKAWDRAAADINQDPESHRTLLLQKIRVPPNIQTTFKIPPYPRREIPSVSQWEDVMAWMVAKGLLKKPLSYDGSVTSAFLP